MEPEETKKRYNTPIQNMVDDSRRDSTVGPLIGSVIIILIILVGGLYFWGSIIVDRKNQIESEEQLRLQAEETQRQLDEAAARQAEQDAQVASSTVEAEADVELDVEE